MFRGIESADRATQATRHLRYPPNGDRGVATYNRAYGFGPHPERLETANERVLGIVQIKSKQAVERVVSHGPSRSRPSSTRPLWGARAALPGDLSPKTVEPTCAGSSRSSACSRAPTTTVGCWRC
jgi:hypothetical protein